MRPQTDLRHSLPALLVTAALVLLPLGAQGVPPAQSDVVQCGDTITTDTRLTNDLVNCPGLGLVVGADDVTLDLNGHTVDGNGVADFEGIQAIGHDGLTIKGGRIRDFVEGVAVISAHDVELRDLVMSHHRHVGIFVADSAHVRVRDTSSTDIAASGIFVAVSHYLRIENNTVTDSGGGIAARASDHLRIRRNTTTLNEFDGVSVFEGTTHATISRNVTTANGFSGIVVEGGHNSVTHNRISENGDNVVIAGTANLVAHNRIDDAVGFPDDPVGGFGIIVDGGDRNRLLDNDIRGTASNGIRVVAFDPEATGAAEDSVVRGNRVTAAQLDGILIDETATGTRLVGNWAEGSGDDGLDVESESSTLARNTARNNHDLGIEAVPGVIDGGGNRAAGNGDPAQCTNISCS
jgi:parallel beta-helix repeat protein